MIHVIATIEVAEGRREEFLTEFSRIAEPVRAEEGCLAYGPAIDAETDIDAQEVKGPDVVTVIEQWDSVEALKAHLVAPHMIAYRSRVTVLVQNVTLHIFEPA